MPLSAVLGHFTPPFGPLNPLHAMATNSPDFNRWTAVAWLAACIPLAAQAILLLLPRPTRPTRLVLGGFGTAALAKAWLSFRANDPALTAVNGAFTFAVCHLLLKYLEWSLLAGPIVDPFMLPPYNRHILVAALDLTLNVRHVWLGSVGLDPTMGPPNATITTPVVGRYLPRPQAPRSRWSAVARHTVQSLWRALVLDAFSTFLELVGSDTIAVPGGIPRAQDTFVATTGVRCFGLDIPAAVLGVAAQLAIPVMVWMLLGHVFHAIAAVTVASGLWEVESWDVDMFDAPWRASSVNELWGRRWHQVLRHQCVIAAASALQVLGVPPAGLPLLLMTFCFSAIFHAVGHLSMTPVPDLGKIMLFFVLSGLGCAAELVFGRLTGRRVGGWAGRVWAWVFMMTTGRLAADAWLDVGFATAFTRLPSLIGWAVGGGREGFVEAMSRVVEVYKRA